MGEFLKFDEIIIGAGSDGCAVVKHIGDSLSSSRKL